MKTLIFVRHAKTEKKSVEQKDEDRKLLKEGIKDAKLISKILFKKDIPVDIMISSPAKRALETAHILAERFEYPIKKIMIENFLYEDFEPAKFLAFIKTMDDQYNTIMIFGHNPTFNSICNHLYKKFNENIPKCGVVGIGLNIKSWKNTNTISKKLLFFEYPKKYKD